jgi:3-hydroxyisobutyrate dehydrogenase-like beta-hydroxyacid dehydrogenase
MRKIGFIGVGNMGKGICHNLIKAGNEVSVYDTDRQAMERFANEAHMAQSADETFIRSEVTFLSLPNSNVIEHVMEDFFKLDVSGKLVVDLSTSYPISTRNLYERMKERGGAFVDSPLIAGPQEAWDATLNIVLAGDKEVIDKYSDMFQSYCKHYDYVGQSGNGHLMKLAQNWAGLLQAIMYAQLYPVMAKHGIDQKTLYNVLDTEFFDNWFFQFYSDKYVNKNYRMDFALDLGLKDLTYMKKLCDELNVPGFMLDGAIDLCRVALKEGKDRGIAQDMSHVADTMYQYVGL